ncbi:RNA-binding protein [Heliorestis acidaminivorans]|uniref:RNA-binding protein n=1 Tax=Heliorestis acidaminivorans TaxID=553427 RepID=A0A6I0EXV6_9FIRM|nr:RNA-binding protein [Heliorestis acidaminivorans]KAB2951395.1 RNA-binding protein [Heliorestis acidaminivorans]
METSEVVPGQLVRSISGRDVNRYFLVLKALDQKHLLITDGLYRKVEKPKKKKLKHIEVIDSVAKDIGEMLQKGKTPTNAQAASAVQQMLVNLELGS